MCDSVCFSPLGKKSDDPKHMDYVPSMFNYSHTSEKKRKQMSDRQDRICKRRSLVFNDNYVVSKNQDISDEDILNDCIQQDVDDQNFTVEDLLVEKKLLLQKMEELEKENQSLKSELNDTKIILQKHQNDSISRQIESRKLKKIIANKDKLTFNYKSVRANPKKFKFYTGINNGLFKWLIKYGPKDIVSRKLSVEDHLFIILVKLRVGLTNKDISYRTGIEYTTMSRIIRIWLQKFSKFMADYLIYWPDKLALRSNLPNCFKKNYSKCVSIIDCTEIFIERPLNLNARAKTWSNYKNNNTIKYLVGCAPTGAINFLSDICRIKKLPTNVDFLNGLKMEIRFLQTEDLQLQKS